MGESGSVSAEVVDLFFLVKSFGSTIEGVVPRGATNGVQLEIG